MQAQIDLTTAQGVTQYMRQSVSEEDWNNRCDAVKAANGGYPSFWYSTIVLSGVMSQVVSSWK